MIHHVKIDYPLGMVLFHAIWDDQSVRERINQLTIHQLYTLNDFNYMDLSTNASTFHIWDKSPANWDKSPYITINLPTNWDKSPAF